MNLHFSNWSAFMPLLDQKGIPHGDTIIKIYGSRRDPREILKRPSLFVFNINDSSFGKDEVFKYQNRESYTGLILENKLEEIGLNEAGKEYARALFRFSNLPEIQSCQFMMSIKNPDGKWMFDNPFVGIDGIRLARINPQKGNPALHLDIFSQESLFRLRQLFDIDREECLVKYSTEISRLISLERG
ncbi:MAG: hypothetical protein Q7R97_03745 [Candidatus Daviesbacteria bacterium]|nr:hypothetical protein [Candidatus Daviesbacteria bacterium]